MSSQNTTRVSRYRTPLRVAAIVAVALVALLVGAIAFVVLFDWNRARPTVEDLLGRALERQVQIGGIDVDWRASAPLSPLVRVTGLRIGNPSWVKEPTMATVGLIETTVSPGLLWSAVRKQPVTLPYVRVDDVNAGLVRDKEGRANWQFGPPSKPDEPSRVQVQQLRLGPAKLRFHDETLRLFGEGTVESRNDPQWATHVEAKGNWEGAPFSLVADSGPLLSLQNSGTPFPLRVNLRAGTSRIQATGTVADLAKGARIDAKVDIAGQSLSGLYPPIVLSLPQSPAFRLTGHLTKNGDRVAFESFNGTVGRTDLRGNGSFEFREPRPMLTARLQSNRLDLADLGGTIGAQQAAAAGKKAADATGGTKADKIRNARENAKKTAAEARPPGRVLPGGKFGTEGLNEIDADITLRAEDLRLPERAPLTDFAASLKLAAGVLTIEPLSFGLAGGEIVGTVRLDGTAAPPKASAAIDFRRVQLGKLLPVGDGDAGSGLVGAQIRLHGRGESIAAMLGTSTGTVTVGIAGGTVSQLATAAASLNGGKVLASLLGGDKKAEIRCAGAALDVRDGVARISHFIFDTDQARFSAEGTIDLRKEVFSIELRSEPKKPSLLSLRAPVYVTGTFEDPSFGVDAKAFLRGGAALALAAVNPLAALLPLIETGPGEDSNCREVLAPVKGATREAKSKSDAPPAPPANEAEARRKK